MNKRYYNQYMGRALELALNGWGGVSPNPLVGAVLVKGTKIVGEGFHKVAGRDHAEIKAIRAAGRRAKGGTLIVNLEPCCHYGKTPPCTDAIIASGIKEVVYGMKDPNPLVGGKGLQALKKAGIAVEGPVMEKEAAAVNRIFLNWIARERPYVISKVAISLDGKLATGQGDSKWITGEKCRRRVHYWRAGVDAVLVGAGTVRKDDPLLNSRGVGCLKQPIPVIVSSCGKIDLDKKIWGRKPAPILVCTDDSGTKKIAATGARILKIEAKSGEINFGKVLEQLGKMGITSLFVEGGAKIHSQFIEQKLVDYMVVNVSTKLIGSDGLPWLNGLNVGKIKNAFSINLEKRFIVDNDIVIEGEMVY